MLAFLSSKIRVSLWIIIILLNMDVIKNMLLYYCYCYCWVISSSDDHEFDLLFMLLYYRWATATSADHGFDYTHVMTSLLSHCFLWSSWIWLYHHSCYYNFAESLLPLLIMNLIKLLFTSLHYHWVIAISENQEFDYVIIHVIASLLSHFYLWWSLQYPAG